MDNITHSLAGALLGQMGLKRMSRLAMAGCILGANAPDIDVFAPLLFDVDGIAFHRGPTHALWAPPLLAAAIVGLLWLYDRWRPGHAEAPPFRAGLLFVATLLATFSHSFLDWLTTYAVNLFVPFDRGWYSADAIFIVDLVYWLLMAGGIIWSARRFARADAHPGRPAQVAGGLLLAYIVGNIGLSAVAERATATALRQRGIEPVLVVASPPPLIFWERTMAWRSATHWGGGDYSPGGGLRLDPAVQPLSLDNPLFLRAKQRRRTVRSFLSWSRMPIVVSVDGRPVLSDQRYFGPIRTALLPAAVRSAARRASFLVPLD